MFDVFFLRVGKDQDILEEDDHKCQSTESEFIKPWNVCGSVDDSKWQDQKLVQSKRC